MRLGILDHGHRARARWFLSAVRLSGTELSDVVKVFLYRPEMLGHAMLGLAPVAMRGPSYWTAAEREHLAVVTGRLNQCPYCVDTHLELIRLASDGEVDPANPDAVRPELAATAEFVEQVTRHPEVTPDPHRVRAAGVPDEALDDALHVNLVFNIVNRLANAFDYQLRGDQLVAGTRTLHRIGYRMPGVLTRTGSTRKLPRRSGPAGYAPFVGAIRGCVSETPGTVPTQLRDAAAAGDGVPEPWQPYVAKVREASYQVTDADVEELKAAGCTEDQIFEVTVAAAVGPALRSRDAGYAVLDPDRERSQPDQ